MLVFYKILQSNFHQNKYNGGVNNDFVGNRQIYQEVDIMFKYDYYFDESTKDSCDISEEQRAYVIALGLRNACSQVGR